MTTGTFTLLPPSPPFPCSIDVLFRPPFIRLDGGAIAAVQNRVDGSWHEQTNDRLRMRYAGGLARGNFTLAFPTLSTATYRNPAAAVCPVGAVGDAVSQYLATCRREVER